MNQFRKISFEQYQIDVGGDANLRQEYDAIKLPARATKYSAGYDFFSPLSFSLEPGETIKIPTGICVELDNDKFLGIYPRSGLGFKYRLQLDNTIGLIDADYFCSDNEGHIWIKLTNDTRENKRLEVEAGQAIAQGIIQQYFLTIDDAVSATRNGGFGSTDGK